MFRRLLDDTAFASAIDFVDMSVIPPGSTIGKHEHRQTEELYFVVMGNPLVTIESDCRRLMPGDLSVVRSGQSHELINDGAEAVVILVVQVRL